MTPKTTRARLTEAALSIIGLIICISLLMMGLAMVATALIIFIIGLLLLRAYWKLRG